LSSLNLCAQFRRFFEAFDGEDLACTTGGKRVSSISLCGAVEECDLWRRAS